MIIRSQNKKAIVNLNMIDTIEERDNQIRYFSGGGMETVGLLGQYSTEEKAIKVLDMIQDKYSEYVAIANGWDNIHSINVVPKVFQMPLDEEVEV